MVKYLPEGGLPPRGVALAIPTSECCGPSLYMALTPTMPPPQEGCRALHLEMEDAGISILKALAVGNHSV